MDESKDIKIEDIKDEIKPSHSGEVLFPRENQYSHIRNKIIRNQKYQKTKRELKKVCSSACLCVTI